MGIKRFYSPPEITHEHWVYRIVFLNLTVSTKLSRAFSEDVLLVCTVRFTHVAPNLNCKRPSNFQLDSLPILQVCNVLTAHGFAETLLLTHQ